MDAVTLGTRLDYDEIKAGFRVRKRNGSLRPGKQVNDSQIIALGKAIVAGEQVQVACKRIGISNKTGYRWKRRLGFSVKKPTSWELLANSWYLWKKFG